MRRGIKLSKKQNQLTNIGLLIFTVIFIFILFEFGITYYGNLKDNQVQDKDFITDESPIRIKFNGTVLMDTLKPNSSMYLAGAYVKINSLGFRDYEYSLKKPNDVFRIAVLGDSFTFGYGIELEDTYTKQLEKMLNENSSQKYEVLNFGGNGGNTLLEAEYLEKKVINFEPDLVIVGFFPNDADYEYISDEEYCLKNNANFQEKNSFIMQSSTYNFLVDRYNSILKKQELNEGLDDSNYYFLNLYSEDNPGFNCFKEGVKKFSEISNKENTKIIFIIIPSIGLTEEISNIIYEKTILC
mgnify:FL=1